MNLREHLLVCLSEECAEIQKEISKGLRFGLDDVDPRTPDGPTNQEKLICELNDLLGVVEMLCDDGVLPSDWQDRTAQIQKNIKVTRFLKYATDKGTLNQDLNAPQSIKFSR